MEVKNKKRRLVGHGDYLRIANCRTKIPAILRGMSEIFKNSRDIARDVRDFFTLFQFFIIYSTIRGRARKMFCGTVIGKQSNGTKILRCLSTQYFKNVVTWYQI